MIGGKNRTGWRGQKSARGIVPLRLKRKVKECGEGQPGYRLKKLLLPCPFAMN